jgi:hypothetical protein
VEEFFQPIFGVGKVFVIGEVTLEAHKRSQAPNGKADTAQVGEGFLGRTRGILFAHLQMAGDHDPDDLDLFCGLAVGEPGKVSRAEGIEMLSIDAMFEGIGVADLTAAFAG